MILPLVGFRFANAEFRPPKAIHFICQGEASTMTAVVIYAVNDFPTMPLDVALVVNEPR